MRILALFILSCPAWATIAHVNGAQGFFNTGGGGTSSIATGSFSVSTGNLLVCSAFWSNRSATALTPTDTGGDLFISTASISSSYFTGSSEQWYAKNVTAATEVITLNFSVSTGYAWLVCNQYSGADPVSPFDVVATGTNTVSVCGANAMVTNPFTTTSANEVLVASLMIQLPTSTPDVGTGYTLRENTTDFQLWTEDQLVSAIQTGAMATFGTTACNSFMGIVGTFRQASSTSAVKHKVRMDN